MSFQASLFLTTVIMGIIAAFIYDWFRVFRRIVKHNNMFIQLEDCLYWIFVSLTVFIIMLNKNYGEIRVFLVCGVFIGMIVYFILISPLFMNISMTVVHFIKKILIIIITPFKVIIKILSYPFNFIKKILYSTYNRNKNILKNYKRCAKIKKRKLVNKIKSSNNLGGEDKIE